MLDTMVACWKLAIQRWLTIANQPAFAVVERHPAIGI